MKPYLQAMYNNLPDPALLADIRGLGFVGVRCDMQLSARPVVDAAVRGVADAGLEGLFITRLEQMPWYPAGTQVELRNEMDIEGPPAHEYGLEMQHAYNHSLVHGLKLWVGDVSNPHKRGRDYLGIIAPYLADMPSVGLTWHRYPNGGSRESFSRPHDEFQTREDEVAYIRSLIGNRPWAISEFGYHTAVREGKWFWQRSARWTDDDVAQLTTQEWAFWERHGAEFAVLYQITDGPSEDRLDRFGIRRLDGSWKPSAYIVPR